MQITYHTHGVCANTMHITVCDGKIEQLSAQGGCSGNLQGLASLLTNMPIEEAILRLDGIRCKGKPTSCPDQIAKALQAMKEGNNHD